MRKIKILIIDDDEKICQNLKTLLEKKDYNADYVLSGEEGIRYVENKKVSIVILDLKMPGLDGEATLKKIKEINPNVGIMILTGYPSLDSAVSLLKNGAHDYISKPYDIDDIVRAVEGLIKKLGIVVDPFSELISRIGVNIKSNRQKDGLSINQLALKSNLSVGLISQIENSKTVPSLTTLFKISEALKMDVRKLF